MQQRVYIISSNESVKVGVSRDPLKRLAKMQCGSPVDMKLIYQTDFCDNAESVESDEADSESGTSERDMLEEFIARIQTDSQVTHVSTEEAKKLDDLGKALKDIQEDMNRADDDITESGADLSEPNLSDANLGGANLGEANSPEE